MFDRIKVMQQSRLTWQGHVLRKDEHTHTQPFYSSLDEKCTDYKVEGVRPK